MRFLIYPIVLCLLLAACGPVSKPFSDKTGAGEDQQALTLMSSGDYAGAAAEYERLAAADKRKANFFLLRATDAYIRSGQAAPAEALLPRLQSEKLSAVEISELNIAQARLALLQEDALKALNLTQTVPPADSPRFLQRMFHETRATALERDKQLLAAAQTRIDLARFLDTPEELTSNQSLIWQLLEQSDLNNLQQSYAQTASAPVQASWLELAIISKTLIYSPVELQVAVTSWTQRYPDHPAQATIIPLITATAAQADTPPQQIALLLPFNTSYDDAANVIRDGFLAAWYADSGNRPLLKIYTATAENIIEVYTQAVTDGADTIVGPLEKEALSALITSANISVKTLALNQISSTELTNTVNLNQFPLYQFSLLPEDEARLAARRAWADGHANALVITQDNSWGERIYTAFSSEWNTLGGRLIEHVRMPVNIQDFSSPVKQLLNVDKSEQRAKELTAALRRNMITEPRYRRDADMIFLASTPVIAQQIVPQLRYYRADDIPAYSISSIYGGQYDPEANSDLNNVIFSDMPWLLDPVLENAPLQSTLNNTLNQSLSPYRRLYAFGIDAYRLLPELGRLKVSGERITGLTGTLSLDSQGYVQWQPVWAQFVNGTPQLLTETPSLQP